VPVSYRGAGQDRPRISACSDITETLLRYHDSLSKRFALRKSAAAPEAAAKRQILVCLEADVGQRTKICTIERGTTASWVAQQALLASMTKDGVTQTLLGATSREAGE
jgi:hypothetical protein